MKKSKFEKWLVELQAELYILDGDTIEPIDRLRHTLPLVAAVISDVKSEILKTGFSSIEDEIYFFKFIKPGLYALQLFELSWYNLIIQRPVGTKETVRAFYEDELLFILRFFRLNAFHYQYYKTKSDELDDRYFVRDAQPGSIPILEIIDPLPGFSTALDYTFAKFIAYERLQVHLLEQLTLSYAETNQFDQGVGNKRALKWTGDYKLGGVSLWYLANRPD
jgi:hypothetical protein